MNLSGNERYRPGRTRSGTSTFASAARQGMVQCNLRLHGAIHSRPVRRWPRSPLTYAVDGGLTIQAATVRGLPLTQLEICISACKKVSIMHHLVSLCVPGTGQVHFTGKHPRRQPQKGVTGPGNRPTAACKLELPGAAGMDAPLACGTSTPASCVH